MTKTKSRFSLAVKLWVGILITVLTFLVGIPAILLDGFVVLRLYEWFILSTFTNAPTIHLAEAIGISMLFGFMGRTLSASNSDPNDSNSMKLYKSLSFLYLAPLVSLGMGYIVHLYV